MYLDKEILKEYVDACKLVEETEEDVKRLNNKKKTIIHTSVSGSNPEFPYQPKHFHIEGTAITYQDDMQLKMEEKLLEERKAEAEKIKLQVQQWMNTLTRRMQRIIRLRYFEEMSWEDVAKTMGRKATADSIRMEFERTMKENIEKK